MKRSMGYTAAVLDKHGEDASNTILAILSAAGTGPVHSYGVADHRDVENCKTPEYTSLSAPVLIASKNIFLEMYPPEPLHQGHHSLVFNGMLLDTAEPNSLAAANIIRGNPVTGVKTLMEERAGFYTVAVATEDMIIAGVDHIGTIPLYYGENRDTVGVATNKKMLWSIGVNPTPINPGELVKITHSGIEKTQVMTLKKPVPALTTAETLDKIFTKTTAAYAKKTPRATVAFSGGIDSLLTAYYLRENMSLELIWTGLENQRETGIAETAADYLGLRLHVEAYTEEDVEATLDAVLASIEEPDPVKTGIAYPFHWAAEKTHRLGYTTMYSGNGADELFGGYKKYHEKYLSGEDPSNDIYNDVANSYLQNFHRDTKTCLDQGVRLLLPFTHPRLVDYALCIPVEQKLPDSRDMPRKMILRKLAKLKGIPDRFADRPKKAAQYSSGVNKALVKIAKKHGLGLRDYTKEKFREIRKEFSRD